MARAIYLSAIRTYNWLQCNLKKQGEAWCQCNLHCKNENKERSSTWSLCDAACWFKQCSLVSLNILRGRELDKAQLIKALQQIRGRSCCGICQNYKILAECSEIVNLAQNLLQFALAWWTMAQWYIDILLRGLFLGFQSSIDNHLLIISKVESHGLLMWLWCILLSKRFEEAFGNAQWMKCNKCNYALGCASNLRRHLMMHSSWNATMVIMHSVEQAGIWEHSGGNVIGVIMHWMRKTILGSIWSQTNPNNVTLH